MSKEKLEHTLLQWERVMGAAEAIRKELPYLETYRAQLGADLEYVKALRERRLALRAEKLQVTQDLRALVARGRELASRIQSGARALYGSDSGKLEAFGVRPRSRKRSRDRPIRKNEAPRNPTAG
jgi:hypothetical protein